MSTSTTNLAGEKKLDALFSKKRKRLSHKVSAVSGISEFILKSHLQNKYFKNADSIVIYNGFDFSGKKISDAVQDELTFGFIGQIKKHKGIHLLLQAFSALKSDKAKLLIAGNAPKDLIDTYKGNPKIEFWGFIQSDEFLTKIDVLVVPSLWPEPFGRVVMEALASHKVVIGSKMGGIPELLKNNLEFLFEPNEAELHQLMNKFLTDSDFVRKFSFNNSFLKEFSIESMVEKYESEYKRLILRADEN